MESTVVAACGIGAARSQRRFAMRHNVKRILGGMTGVVLVTVAGTGVAQAQPQAPAFQEPPQTKQLGGTGYAPPGGAWGPVSQSTDYVLGYPGTVIDYSYQSQSDASPIHATAKHYTNAQGSDPGPEAWSEFGAGTTGRSGPMVWGNAGAYPAMRFQSVNVLGAQVTWTAGAGVP